MRASDQGVAAVKPMSAAEGVAQRQKGLWDRPELLFRPSAWLLAMNVDVVVFCFCLLFTADAVGLFRACAVLAESGRNVQQTLELIRT
jgi:hypothetical protein